MVIGDFNSMSSIAKNEEKIPLSTDRDGVIRIGGTRVTLDTVVAAFGSGSTPEEIVQQYPSLRLADVYSVIGYFLHHREEIEEYLERRRGEATEVRKQNEQLHDTSGIRERLLSRR
jgi:uncharacterized protein (DUF433 family)